jgi:hypothetical protein
MTRRDEASDRPRRSPVVAWSASARGARATFGRAASRAAGSSPVGRGRRAVSRRADARATEEGCSPTAADTESPFVRVRLGAISAIGAEAVASPLDGECSRAISRRASCGASTRFALASPALGRGSSGPSVGGGGVVVEAISDPSRAAVGRCGVTGGSDEEASCGSLAGALDRRLVSTGPGAVDRCSLPGSGSVRSKSSGGSGSGRRSGTGSGFDRRATAGGDAASGRGSGDGGSAGCGSTAGRAAGDSGTPESASGAGRERDTAGPSSMRPRRTPPRELARAARAALRGGAEACEGAPAG